MRRAILLKPHERIKKGAWVHRETAGLFSWLWTDATTTVSSSVQSILDRQFWRKTSPEIEDTEDELVDVEDELVDVEPDEETSVIDDDGELRDIDDELRLNLNDVGGRPLTERELYRILFGKKM